MGTDKLSLIFVSRSGNWLGITESWLGMTEKGRTRVVLLMALFVVSLGLIAAFLVLNALHGPLP